MTYHLFENELNQISHLNTVAMGFFSAGGMFTSLLITLVTSWIFGAPLSDVVSALALYGCIAAGILALICYVIGGWSVWQKIGMIDVIKKETATRQP